MLNLELKIPPVAVALVIAGLMWLVSVVTPSLAVPATFRACAAGALTAAAALVIVGALVAFCRAGTTVNPMTPGRTAQLVDVGVYRFTRNPMYVGLLIVLIGWAVLLSSPLALGLCAAFVLYMNRFQVRPEERILSALFGQDYRHYMGRVRRWL